LIIQRGGGIEVQNGKKNLYSTHSQVSASGIEDFDSVCVSHARIDGITKMRINNATDLKNTKKEVIEKLKARGFCPVSTFKNNSSVDSSMPDVTKIASLEDMYQFLLSLQKPGSFDVKKHLPVLLTILSNSEFVKAEPELISGALANVLKVSDVLYEQILKNHTVLKDTIAQNSNLKAIDLCLTNEDLKEIQVTVQNYVDETLKSTANFALNTSLPRNIEDWKIIAPLVPILSTFSNDKKDHYIDYISDQLFVSAERTQRAISERLMRTLVMHAIKPYFGVSSEVITEAELVPEANGQAPTLSIFASHPIVVVNQNLSNYNYSEGNLGIYSRKVLLNDNNNTSNHEVNWQVGNEEWQAKINLAKSETLSEKIDSDEVNKILFGKKVCHFVSASSHWNESGLLGRRLNEEPERKPYVKVVAKPEDVLAACIEIKKDLGEGACHGIEFSGHMGGNASVGHLYGIQNATRRVENGKETLSLRTLPSDRAKFDEVNACLKSILKKDQPLFLTSCYSGDKTTLTALTDIFQAPAIGANGLCMSDGWGAFSRPGFTKVKPKVVKKDKEEEKSTFSFLRVR